MATGNTTSALDAVRTRGDASVHLMPVGNAKRRFNGGLVTRIQGSEQIISLAGGAMCTSCVALPSGAGAPPPPSSPGRGCSPGEEGEGEGEGEGKGEGEGEG